MNREPEHPGTPQRVRGLPDPFDFEAWARLAREDPEAFESARRRVIEAFIDSAPAHRRRRLQGLQFRVDLERRRARTPLAACIRISGMMWDSVTGPDGLRAHLARLSETLDRALHPRAGGPTAEARALPRGQPSRPRAPVVRLRPRR